MLNLHGAHVELARMTIDIQEELGGAGDRVDGMDRVMVTEEREVGDRFEVEQVSQAE